MNALSELVAGMDIYLLDLVLRGEVPEGARVLDAGCGFGRNLNYFMRSGHAVAGIDRDARAVERCRAMAAALGVHETADFRVEAIEDASFEPGTFDLVICNAVLHFAADEDHFRTMTGRIRDLLAPGGQAFCRLASDVGIESRMAPSPGRGSRWRRMPDGSDRFVVDLDFLLADMERLGVRQEGAIKTVNVQNRRCMSTWIWRRP